MLSDGKSVAESTVAGQKSTVNGVCEALSRAAREQHRAAGETQNARHF